MRRVSIGLATASILAVSIIVGLVLGGEPPQPALATVGPRLEARFIRLISTSPQPVRAIAFDAAGRTIAVTGVDGRVRILAVPSGLSVREFAHPDGATALDRSPDGRLVATAGYDGAVRLWDVESGTGRVIRGSSAPLWALKFSPDGKILAVAGEDRRIHLFALDGTPIRTLRGHRLNIWDLAFSPDGRTLASGSFDHSLNLWDVASGRLIRTAGEHREAIVALDQRRTDGLIVTGGDDATLRYWRANGAPLRTAKAGQFVDALAFSADGRWLATGGRESHGINALLKSVFGHRPFGGHGTSARLWRVADGAMIAALDRQPDDIVTVGFSGDGSWLATGSDDGSVALWKLVTVAG